MADAAETRSRSTGSFFEWYKKGQGVYTRYGTAIGAGVLLAGGLWFLSQTLQQKFSEVTSLVISLVICVPFAVLIWWVVGRNRKACDFFIATEGEMKKVNWSSKKEVKASTLVVIIVTLLMAILLFGVDAAFQAFFTWIGVLHLGGAS